MKKILILTSTFPKNKNDFTPSFTYTLSEKYSKYFNIFILAPYSANSKINENINNLRIKRFKYWFNQNNLLADNAILPNLKRNKFLWFQVPFFIVLNFKSMYKLIKKENIEIIHAHWILTQGLLAVIYKKLFNKNLKILVTSHGADIYGLQKLNFLKKWVLNDIDKLTVVSYAIKNEVLKLNPKLEIDVIPMGIDTKFFSTNNEIMKKHYFKNINLLFVGRLSEKKGVIYLIKSMQKFKEMNYKFKLNIVGDGEEKEKLHNLVKKYKLEKEIIFLGGIKLENLPELYRSADVFIGPSIKTKSGDKEGFGLVFAEALACGCPVISTDLDTISDIIKHKETGLVVKQKNSEDIVDKILMLLNDKKLYVKLRKNGRKYIVTNFDIDVIAKKYLNIILKW